MPVTRLPQATIAAVHPDGSVDLVTDDGRRVRADAAAVAAGRWRAPRAGQRVRLRRAADGTVAAVLPPVPAPGP